MKNKTIGSLFIVGALLAGITWLAAAQSGGMNQSGGMGGMMGNSGNMSGMMNGMSGMTGNASGMQGMMQMAGMTSQMLARGQMMMHASIQADDPGALLGLKDQLGLTTEQSAQLEAIATQAREQARAVLTETQRTQLQSVSSGTGTMAAMMSQMMTRLQESGTDNGAPSTMQNMMQMMMNMPMMGGAQTTSP